MEEVVVGKVFPGKTEMFSFFEEYFRQTYQPFIKHVTTNTRVVFRCSRWRQRKSQSNGVRPKQHYLFTGCNAHINICKGNDNNWKVTLVNLGHNHDISREEFDVYRRRAKLTEQDYKLISNLIQAKVKDSVVAEVLKTERDKFLTRRDVANIRTKLFKFNSQEPESGLTDFLKKVLEEKGMYSITYNSNGIIKTLFIASEIMISTFKKSQSPVIQIDILSEFCQDSYRLLGFSYFSCTTGKAEFASLAFIYRETLEVIQECLTEFKKICARDPEFFLIDKDFTETSAIQEVFPFSTTLLSTFHVLKHMKDLLTTAVCHTETRKVVFELFQKVLYSETEEDYEENKFDLLLMANDIAVKVGQNNYAPFSEQFNKNWDYCKETWAYCWRKSNPSLQNSTTNKIERSFWTLKNYINTNFDTGSSICDSVIGVVNFVSNRLTDGSLVSKSVGLEGCVEKENTDPNVDIELESEFPEDTTPCDASVEPELNKNSSNNDKVEILTQNEKYEIALEYFKECAKVLSYLDTKEFFERLEEHKKISEK